MSTSTLTNLAIATIVLFGTMLLWSIFIAPLFRRKAAKKKEQLLDKEVSLLKKGDKILMASGMIGRFVKKKQDTLYVEISENVVIKIDRHGIMGVYKNEPLDKDEK